MLYLMATTLTLTLSAHASDAANYPINYPMHNDIAFITGGVGHDDVIRMRRHASNFSLNLQFSEGAAGQYATDINVKIYDENSNLVFKIKKSQPLLYINLPAGTYTVVAVNQGMKLRHKLSIEDGINQKVTLNWKIDEDLSSEARAE